MLKKLTEDVIQWFMKNASMSNLQSDVFQNKIEKLMLWDEQGSVKPIIDSNIEQNPLGKPRTDLTKVPSINNNQSNLNDNDPSINISRQTNPLDDRCNLKYEIHFCMLGEHFQTCKILWRIW
jgi:hypothetical protein